jgi:hypothetical protein
LADLRDGLGGAHARVPSNVAHLLLGWRTFLRFASDVGACDERESLYSDVERALATVARGQAEHLRAEDPAERYVALLAAALESGAAHVADLATGATPDSPRAWGWRADDLGWRSQGTLIGYLEREDLYLIPDAAYAAARRLGEASGQRLTIQERTLEKRLHAAGLLASTDTDDGRLRVRRMVAGRRARYLHLATRSLSPPQKRANRATTANEGQPDRQNRATVAQIGPVRAPLPGHENQATSRDDGRDGPIGPVPARRERPRRDDGRTPGPERPQEPGHRRATTHENRATDQWEDV